MTSDEGNTLSAQLSCSFAEVSAKMNINVHEVIPLQNVAQRDENNEFQVFEEMVAQLRYIETVEHGRRGTKEHYPSRGSSLCCFL